MKSAEVGVSLEWLSVNGSIRAILFSCDRYDIIINFDFILFVIQKSS